MLGLIENAGTGQLSAESAGLKEEAARKSEESVQTVWAGEETKKQNFLGQKRILFIPTMLWERGPCLQALNITRAASRKRLICITATHEIQNTISLHGPTDILSYHVTSHPLPNIPEVKFAKVCQGASRCAYLFLGLCLCTTEQKGHRTRVSL